MEVRLAQPPRPSPVLAALASLPTELLGELLEGSLEELQTELLTQKAFCSKLHLLQTYWSESQESYRVLYESNETWDRCALDRRNIRTT